MNFKREFVGNEAQNRRMYLNITSPIERGIVRDWEDMERVDTHQFPLLNKILTSSFKQDLVSRAKQRLGNT